MSKPLTPEDQLFRQFRRGGVSSWYEGFWQANRNVIWLVLVGMSVASCSWAALTYLPRTTGQETASVESWRQRIDEAEEGERVPVFQSLFQVQNDRVIDLGINSMLASDATTRIAAAKALEDSVAVWRTWDIEDSVPHITRVAEGLATQVGLMNLPEQAVAIDVARQFLLWPRADDRVSHTALLLQCEAIFREARSAFSTPRAVVDSEVEQSYYPISASDQVAASLLNRSPTTFVVGESSTENGAAGVPALSASYRRGSGITTNGRLEGGRREDPSETEVGSSQVPLVDGAGNLLDVRTVDPTTLDLPGGLIPVPLTGQRPTASEEGLDNERQANRNREVPVWQGGYQRTVEDVVRDRNAGVAPIQPGDDTSDRQQPEAYLEPRRLVASPESSGAGFGSDSSGFARPLQETMQRQPTPPQDTGLRGERTEIGMPPERSSVQQMPFREPEPIAWVRPQQPMIRWAHIDVMRLLQSPDANEVQAAEEELLRRRFPRAYIGIAYRLTSSDPADRYKLVWDLGKNPEVEPIPFLKWLSADQNSRVREAAVARLEELSDSLR